MSPDDSDEDQEESSDEATLGIRIIDASTDEAEDELKSLRKQAIENLVKMRYPLDPRIESAVEHPNRTHVAGSHARSTKPLTEDNRRGFYITFDKATIEAEMQKIRPSHTPGKRII
ncbi:MAG: hypothetical protein ABSF00_00950 [Candidatus Bathyarchaeia archaeon]|jgi:hypothetical protein